jgi:DNA primase
MQKVGTTAFEEYLTKKRRDFLFFKADLLLEEAGDDVAARSDAIRSSIATLALVEDPLKRAGYLQQFTGRLGLEESLLVNLVNQAVADRRAEVKKEQDREQRRRERNARAENAPGLPPVRPQLPQRPNRKDTPPPPTEDRWAGMQEPGASGAEPPPPSSGDYAPDWGGMDDGGFAGMQEPGFDDGGGMEIPPPFIDGQVPEMPGKDPLKEALLFTGHTFQEQDLVRLLIIHGSKLYDEETNVSVAGFLTANLTDVLEDFDHMPSRKIVVFVTDYVGQHKQGPAQEWYLNHPEESVRQLAVSATLSPHSMSPNWQEKYKVYLRQKHPNENHKLYTDNFLLIFRMEKIDRKCDFCIKAIANAQKLNDEDTVKKYSQVLQKVIPLRSELAAKLGTVVLRK